MRNLLGVARRKRLSGNRWSRDCSWLASIVRIEPMRSRLCRQALLLRLNRIDRSTPHAPEISSRWPSALNVCAVVSILVGWRSVVSRFSSCGRAFISRAMRTRPTLVARSAPRRSRTKLFHAEGQGRREPCGPRLGLVRLVPEWVGFSTICRPPDSTLTSALFFGIRAPGRSHPGAAHSRCSPVHRKPLVLKASVSDTGRSTLGPPCGARSQ